MADGFHVEGGLNRVNRFAFQQKDKAEFNKMIFIDTVFGQLVKIGIGYIDFENRLFGLVQFFAINNDVKIIATARSNCKLRRTFPQLTDGFLPPSDQGLA